MGGLYDPTGSIISADRFNNWVSDIKFGDNSSIAQDWECIHSQGGSPILNNTAAVVEFVAGASDVAAGAGARTIQFSGVDANFNEQTETITLTGATAASSAGSFLYVYRMSVATAGSGLSNLADVTATIGGSTMCQIPSGSGQSSHLQRPVPNNSTMYMTSLGIGVAKGADVNLRIREYDQTNGVWRTKLLIEAYQATVPIPFLPPYRFTQKHLVVVEAITSNAAGYDVSGWFDYIISVGDP